MSWRAPDTRRSEPLLVGDERRLLDSWLDFHRATLLGKCAGFDSRQLRQRAVAPSKLSLHGLVRHMTDVERSWFRRRLAGEQVGYEFRDGGRIDAAFEVGDADAERDFATYAEEIAYVRTLVAERSLEDTAPHPQGGEVSLRWIFLHMIEEYARHNGHADLLRERIDGSTGS